MQISHGLAFALFALTAAAQPVAAAGYDALQPGEALSADLLGGISAGEAPRTEVLTNQGVRAANGGNTISADTLRNGDVDFSSGAFNGFAGVGNIVVNTGNNNIIQGTLSVTIVTTPQ